jgi:hypothetical protein
MFSSLSTRMRTKSACAGSCPRRRPGKPAAMAILLMAASLVVSIPPALSQSGSYSRIAMQEEPRPKPKNQSPKPLVSDALYVCTLSGFGNLAHCYPR